jgi:hypothetical protein
MNGREKLYRAVRPFAEELADRHLKADRPTDPPPPHRFGERLREWVAGIEEYIEQLAGVAAVRLEERDGLLAIADAIDQDQEQQCARLVQRRVREQADLRRQVEEAVERLKYAADQPLLRDTADDEPWPVKDVVDVEPFQTELDRIFGDRSEKRIVTMKEAEPPGWEAARASSRRRTALAMLDECWSPEEAALALGVSVETILRVQAQGRERLEQAERMLAGVESTPEVPEEPVSSGDSWRQTPSLVALIKHGYRRASRGQRAALRAWMRRVLAGDDGNDGEVTA